MTVKYLNVSHENTNIFGFYIFGLNVCVHPWIHSAGSGTKYWWLFMRLVAELDLADIDSIGIFIFFFFIELQLGHLHLSAFIYCFIQKFFFPTAKFRLPWARGGGGKVLMALHHEKDFYWFPFHFISIISLMDIWFFHSIYIRKVLNDKPINNLKKKINSRPYISIHELFCAKNIENKIAKKKSLKIDIKCVWGDCYLYNWGNSVSVAVTVEAVSQTLLPSTDTSQSSRMPTNL